MDGDLVVDVSVGVGNVTLALEAHTSCRRPEPGNCTSLNQPHSQPHTNMVLLL